MESETMNFLEKLALFFGRKKFESYAAAQPQLTDDTLQVAATLDSHTTRVGAMMILGSLAHSGNNLLNGTETPNMVLGHLVIILAGIGLVMARHAISAHDVQVNGALQEARDKLGIASPVVKSILPILALGLSLLFFAPCVHAATNPSTDPILDAGAKQIAASAETAPVSARIALPKLTLIERLPVITNGWTLISSVFQVMTVDGVYSAISDGERGPGIATIAAIIPIDTPDEGMRLLIGPAMVTVDAKSATRVLGEIGITSKILNGLVVQATLLKVPVLGEVIKVTTLDFTDFYFYMGGGPALDADVKHLDRGFGGTAGAGGIGFGKGAS
jgi:hypothetical protein